MKFSSQLLRLAHHSRSLSPCRSRMYAWLGAVLRRFLPMSLEDHFRGDELEEPIREVNMEMMR